MGADEYYEVARSIASSLEKDGFVKEAKTLHSDIDTATVGSQMLMALRFHMRDYIKDSQISEQIRGEMCTLIGAIDKVIP